MMLRTLAFFLATLAVALTADPAAASAPAPDAHPLMATYWDRFLDHWSGVFKKQNGIVMFALIVGALCLFIITRGKWRK